jgi:hypothetical protein
LIRGYVKDKSPFVAARVSVPRLTKRTIEVEFLVDTGSAITVINRSSFDALGIRVEEMPSGVEEQFVAASGAVSYRRVRTDVAFIEDDEGHPPFRFFTRVPVFPAPAFDEPPCVLGMDFLADFRLTVSVREGRVEIATILN